MRNRTTESEELKHPPEAPRFKLVNTSVFLNSNEKRQFGLNDNLLIVFMALCMARVIEKDKRSSLKKVTDELKDKR